LGSRGGSFLLKVWAVRKLIFASLYGSPITGIFVASIQSEANIIDNFSKAKTE